MPKKTQQPNNRGTTAGERSPAAAEAGNGISFNQKKYDQIMNTMPAAETAQETSSDQDSPPPETQVSSSLKEWNKIMGNIPEAELSNIETAPFSDSPEAGTQAELIDTSAQDLSPETNEDPTDSSDKKKFKKTIRFTKFGNLSGKAGLLGEEYKGQAKVLNDHAKNFNNNTEVALNLIKEPNYIKKGFVIDNGKLRDRKGIIKEINRRIHEGQFVVGNQLKKYIKKKVKEIGDSLYISKQSFYTPIKIDPDKRIGGYYPVQVDDEYLNDEQKSDPTFKKNLGKTGFFDENKIKFSNVDLNTSGTLIDDSGLEDSTTMKVAKGIIKYKTGRLSLNPWAIRRAIKNFNTEYGKDEEDHSSHKKKKKNKVKAVDEQNSATDKEQIVSEKKEKKLKTPIDIANKADENLKQAKEAATEYIRNKIKLIPKGKVSIPFFKLTSKGIILDIKTRLESKQIGNPTMTSTFDIKLGDTLSLNYIGSEITNIPNIRISLMSDTLHFSASLDSLISDKSQDNHLFRGTDSKLTAKAGDQKMSLSADEISFNTQSKTFSGKDISGSLDLSVLDYTFNGEIRSLNFKDNVINTGFGVGKLNELNLTNHFKAKNISATFGLLDEKQELVADGNIEFQDGETPILDVSKLSGRIIANFEKTKGNDWELKGTDLENGELNATFFGHNFTANGVSYSSTRSSEISGDKAGWAGEIFGHKAALIIEKPKIKDGKFDFDKVKGLLKDLSYGTYINVPYIAFGVEKEEEKYKIDGASEIEATLNTIPGIDNVSLSGLFTASGYNDGTEVNYSLTNGNLSASLMGNTINLNGVEYSSEQNKLSAETFQWAGTINKKEAWFEITKPIVLDGEGFDFAKAEGQLKEFNIGDWGTLSNIGFHIKKGENNTFYYSGEGKVKFSFSNSIPGIKIGTKEYSISLQSLNFTNDSFSFDSAHISGFDNAYPFGVFKFKPTGVTLYNSDEKKGVMFDIDAEMENILPEPLSGENSFTGNAKITTGLLKEAGEFNASLKIINAKFGGKVNNPLNSLNIFDGWTGNRFDFGASILVFPGVSAEFGIYLQSAISLGEKINISIKKKDDNNIEVDIDGGIASGEIEAGAYAGVQAGSPLIASIGLYLEAYGRIYSELKAKFNKTFQLNGEPNRVDRKDLEITLEGDATVAARLKAVAKALLIFKKVWMYEIASKKLGHFEFSSIKKKEGFDGNPSAMVDNQPKFNEKSLDEEKLNKHRVSEEEKKEYKKMSAIELSDLGTSERFSKKQKQDIIMNFKKQEKNNIDQSKLGNELKLRPENSEDLEKDAIKYSLFDDKKISKSRNPLLKDERKKLNILRQTHAKANNLNAFSKFIDRRIDPKKNINLEYDYKLNYKNSQFSSLHEHLTKIDQNINIAKGFENHYRSLISTVSKTKENKYLKGKEGETFLAEIQSLLALHEKILVPIVEIEKIKKGNIRPYSKKYNSETEPSKKENFIPADKITTLNENLGKFRLFKADNDKEVKPKNKLILKKIGEKEAKFRELYKSALAS